MNKIIVIGNLGRDPELRYTANGQSVTNFSIASNRRYTSNGEQKEETEWFNCSVWGRMAETANQHLQRGQQVYVEGRLKSRTYTTQSGENRHSLDIMVTDFQMLGSQFHSNEAQPQGAPASRANGATPEEENYDDDDLPF